jgi:CRISPR-associated RAMP protein (TIGR02581 family)
MSCANLDTFERRTVISADLRCETALRIGTGRSTDAVATDLPVFRDAQRRPIIPGSSLKGVVRSHAEAILRAYGRPSCDPFSEGRCGEGWGKDDGSAQQRARALRDAFEERACDACRVFGAQSLASHVAFSDCLPVAGSDPIVEVRDGVAIDRDLGRASAQKKFDYEVVAAGSTFALRLAMLNLDDWGEGLVVIAMDLLNEGMARVGGGKSRGLGLVSFRNVSVKTMDKSLQTVEQVWDDYRAQRLDAARARLRNGGA